MEQWVNDEVDRDKPAIRVGKPYRRETKDLRANRPVGSSIRNRRYIVPIPAGDNAQIQGWDGQLVAQVTGLYLAYVPDGASVWEWGVDASPAAKAERDWQKRLGDPGVGVVPADTTFVFVTPHRWPKSAEWIADKNAQGSPWKDVRVIDGVSIEEWAELCPAAAATFARENGFFPVDGVESIDEFWESYSSRFTPQLAEAVVLAGRAEQIKTLLRELASRSGPVRCKGDSLDEVIAFVAATIRSADPTEREFFRARTLIVHTESAARQLKTLPNLVFVVRGNAGDSAGMLAADHPVVIPLGRESIQQANAIALSRPSVYVMTAALEEMGLPKDRAARLPYECGRSISILARRIPNVDTPLPPWRDDKGLIPALLAGAWDRSNAADLAVLTNLSGLETYDKLESALRPYLRAQDAPVETVGNVWAVRAPVDLFVHIEHLLGEEHLKLLQKAASTVFSEIDPSLDLPPGERMYAGLRGNVLTHSSWLRDGLATTLLIIAALSSETELSSHVQLARGFVDKVVEEIPGLAKDWRVIASLRHQLPMLMEAAPVPLFQALEQMLEGDGSKLKPIFQDTKNTPLFASSPHTGLLWALEVAGQDPRYLHRAANVLARLAEIDPTGSLSNRPMGSLKSLFLTWKPLTNAPHELRIATLDTVVADHPEIGWDLLISLIPRHHEVGFSSISPHFRDAGASEREVLTWPIIHETVSAIVHRVTALASTNAKRWESVLSAMSSLSAPDKQVVLAAFEGAVTRMNEAERELIWQPLAAVIRQHKSHPEMDWAMTPQELALLEPLLERVSPTDSTVRDRYLFQERLPDIPGVAITERWEKAEELRKTVIERLMERGGVTCVVKFADEVESPRFVGGALGSIAVEPEAVMQGILATSASALGDRGFIAAASGTAHYRFGAIWRELVSTEYKAGHLHNEQLKKIMEFWPNERQTWDWLDSTGINATEVFWSNKLAWGIQAKGDDLRYAIDQYLLANRPDFVINALSDRVSDIDSEQLVVLIEKLERRLIENPSVMADGFASYSIKTVFENLQERGDIPLEVVAGLEYRFLPLLRRLMHEPVLNSALDRFLSENPEFFVQVISQVFRAQSQRGEPKPEYSEQEQAHAEMGYTLLESFSKIPGRSDDNIDFATMNKWVTEVRELAKDADRLDITEEFVGKLLAHSPADPVDGVWPHRSVREGLENWRSAAIERGLYVGMLNSRGVTSRGSFDGGKQEWDLARGYKEDALKVQRWPRTRALLVQIAESYERSAEREDLEAEQLRLKE